MQIKFEIKKTTAKILIILFSVLCLGVFLTTKAEAVKNASINWDLITYWSVIADTPHGRALKDFVNTVKKKTNNKLVITIRPAGELPYKANEFVRVVGEGSVQMADALVGPVGSYLKLTEFSFMPFSAQNVEQIQRLMELLKPYTTKQLEKYGVTYLSWYAWPEQQIWGSGKPIKSLDDFKGRKIRTVGAEQAKFFKRLGAVPVTLSTAEVATSLQLGVIDAAVTTAITILPAHWYEFVDWGYLLNMNFATSLFIVNSTALNGLPEDVKAVFLDESKKLGGRIFTRLHEQETDYIDKLKKDYGVQINHASPHDTRRAKEIMKGVWDEWAKNEGVAEEFHKILTELKK
jgi:TRAP-type C4-dicarboxylate transport system substrate-binding protein